MVETRQVAGGLSKLGTLTVVTTHTGLRATPAGPGGFELELVREGSQFTVLFLGAHEHFETEDEALGFLVYLLSDQCRVLEFSRGDSPCKWVVQLLVSGSWQTRFSTGTMFFPFWRRKRQQVHQNHAVADPEAVLAAT